LNNKTNQKKILIVGQTPPPYHGQAIMIYNTVQHKYEALKVFHVRMNFSQESNEVGSFKLRKVRVLIKVIYEILHVRYSQGVKNLYYPPAGPNITPILRDLIILFSTRWAFKRTIYHFRAGGISEKLEQSPLILKVLAKAVFSKPNLTIRLSKKNPEDGVYFNSKKDVVIPNGLKDFAKDNFSKNGINNIKKILYVGGIKETKGVLDLLNACAILKSRNIQFNLNLIGQFDSVIFKEKVLEFIKQHALEERVFLLGIKIGKDKWDEYAQANIFCFPSYYECETFGNVLVEAMQFKLPVVSTIWRGIPDIVKNDESGFLVEINSPISIANKLEELIENEALRIRFGNNGRRLFKEKFTEQTYFSNFEDEVYSVCV
jgi:glycosyltransferase involved in cell wall biosynthesis